jgi:hypothetical protein
VRYLYAGRFFTQRRKDAKRCRVSKVFLCAFAPWRENFFLNARLQKYSEYFPWRKEDACSANVGIAESGNATCSTIPAK